MSVPHEFPRLCHTLLGLRGAAEAPQEFGPGSGKKMMPGQRLVQIGEEGEARLRAFGLCFGAFAVGAPPEATICPSVGAFVWSIVEARFKARTLEAGSRGWRL
ncbi:hypothetical protein SAMN05421505_1753 [Sinosporangium album]|uniref:Uncharacterized protein n=1 Tax=Sinosporangium album TaxID=504805 RepID=A0A1G8LQG3_9ACTN|nr:hypothetical protein [Sinosporangium album]SDI57863.1 hypothetical protein SAMN05421505_1753 [Sinosporangium album]